MGHYSKLSEQGERVRVVLEMVPQGGSGPIVRTPKQVQKHLDPAAVDEVVAAYRAGSTLRELAAGTACIATPCGVLWSVLG